MTEKEKRVKQRFGEGRHGVTVYHLTPRYSSWRPGICTSLDRAREIMDAEKRGFALAIEGELGEDMEGIAKEKGLKGIVTEVQQTAAGWICTDRESNESWLRLDPDEDLCGLWELRRDVSNDDNDGRVKNDWRRQDLWGKGTRFLLSRNVGAFDMRIFNLGEERGTPELEEEDLTPEEVAELQKKSGYLVSIVGDAYTENRLDKMSDYFIQSLKPVPINSARAAIEVSRVGEYHIRKVLEHLVDVKGRLPPWHLATLLEQSDHQEGLFAKKDDNAKS